jgi:hypothetical protein
MEKVGSLEELVAAKPGPALAEAEAGVLRWAAATASGALWGWG